MRSFLVRKGMLLLLILSVLLIAGAGLAATDLHREENEGTAELLCFYGDSKELDGLELTWSDADDISGFGRVAEVWNNRADFSEGRMLFSGTRSFSKKPKKDMVLPGQLPNLEIVGLVTPSIDQTDTLSGNLLPGEYKSDGYSFNNEVDFYETGSNDLAKEQLRELAGKFRLGLAFYRCVIVDQRGEIMDDVTDISSWRIDCVTAKDNLLFWFRNSKEDVTGEVRITDTSQMPGGYGIYMVPFVRKEAGEQAKGGAVDLKTDEFVNLCPLEPEVSPINVKVNTNGDTAYLLTAEDSGYFVTVVDISKRQKTAKIKIADVDEEAKWRLRQGDFLIYDALLSSTENGFVVGVRADGTETLFVVNPGTDGNWEIAMTIPYPSQLNSEIDSRWDLWSSNQVRDNIEFESVAQTLYWGNDDSEVTSCSYDGERFVYCRYCWNSLNILVFREGELKCYAVVTDPLLQTGMEAQKEHSPNYEKEYRGIHPKEILVKSYSNR